jgi:hypothetical protein
MTVVNQRQLPEITAARSELVTLVFYLLLTYLAIWAMMRSPLYARIVLRPDSQDSKLYKLDKILDAQREEYFFDSHGILHDR